MKRSIRLMGTIGITVILTWLMLSGTVVNAERLDAFKNRNQYTADVFSDVSEDSWYYDNVKKTYESGLMIGKGGSCFEPLSDITIAEVITIASRIHAIYTTGSESFGVSEPWYQTYLDYARENGIPDFPALSLQKKADRAEFVMILSAALPKEVLGKRNTVDDNMIPDVRNSDPWGSAVYLLYRAGVLIGTDETGAFSPANRISRAEVAAIITRMVDPSLRLSISLTAQHEEAPVKPVIPVPTTEPESPRQPDEEPPMQPDEPHEKEPDSDHYDYYEGEIDLG